MSKSCKTCARHSEPFGFDLDCFNIAKHEGLKHSFDPLVHYCSQWCKQYSETELHKKYNGEITDDLYMYHFALREPYLIKKPMLSRFKHDTILYVLEMIIFVKYGKKLGGCNFGKTTFSFNGKSISFMLSDIYDKTLLLPLYYLMDKDNEI